jgi:hypothetical protein
MARAPDKEKLSFKAIFVGWFVIANALSAVLQMLIQRIAAIILAEVGYSSRQASAVLAGSMGYQAFLLFWEFVFIGLGGYMAARLAGRAEMRHAWRVGILTAGGGVLFVLIILIVWPATSFGVHIFSIVGAIPAALAGGYIRAKRK